MTSTFLTSPLDVVKTRLQSDFYKVQLDARRADVGGSMVRQGLRHFQETFQILGFVLPSSLPPSPSPSANAHSGTEMSTG